MEGIVYAYELAPAEHHRPAHAVKETFRLCVATDGRRVHIAMRVRSGMLFDWSKVTFGKPYACDDVECRPEVITVENFSEKAADAVRRFRGKRPARKK